MPSFVHSPLLWGLVLVGLPILIHLINLLRQRRVQWAAMEFLLESQRKHRTWILLKQLLLLLLRMAAIACVVLMLAQPLLRNEWSQVFGEGDTHHIVLIDDSFSMSDRGADKSVFDQAKRVLVRLAAEAERQPSTQRMTILRFSQAAAGPGETRPDMTSQILTADTVIEIESDADSWYVSHSDAGPQAAIDSIDTLTQTDSADRTVLYVVSDFRSKQWADAPQLRSALKQLDESDVQLHLVNASDDLRPNRGIARIEPATGTRSAGLPVYVDVDVINFSSQPAEDVEVRIEINGEPFERDLLIPKIEPLAVGTARFAFKRDESGPVRVVARIDDDAVLLDNARRTVITLPETARALILTPTLDSPDARVVRAALQTGESATGIEVTTRQPRVLRETDAAELRRYDAIYVVNVPRLDDAEIIALEQYVEQGGGVAFFGGELVDPEFYNGALFRDGNGVFPLPISRAKPLAVDRLETSPDIKTHINPHIAFRSADRNPLIDMVAIRYYLTTFASWSPDQSTDVIAELRNGAPLVVVKPFGAGRVIAVMTKASSSPSRDMPAWHNWHLNPDFPGMLNKIQAFLSATTHSASSQLVGQPIVVELDAKKYSQTTQFQWPVGSTDSSASPPRSISVDAEPLPDQPNRLVARIPITDDQSPDSAVDRSGFYLITKAPLDGAAASESSVVPLAVNVEPSEGDLRGLNGQELAAELPDVEFEYLDSADFVATDDALPGTNLGPYLLYALIGLLLAEQLLAYSASYHSRGREAAR